MIKILAITGFIFLFLAFAFASAGISVNFQEQINASGGGGNVSSVSSGDSYIQVSPTTGDVVVSFNNSKIYEQYLQAGRNRISIGTGTQTHYLTSDAVTHNPGVGLVPSTGIIYNGEGNITYSHVRFTSSFSGSGLDNVQVNFQVGYSDSAGFFQIITSRILTINPSSNNERIQFSDITPVTIPQSDIVDNTLVFRLVKTDGFGSHSLTLENVIFGIKIEENLT